MRYRVRSLPAPPQRGDFRRALRTAEEGHGTARRGTARQSGLASSEHRLSRRRPGKHSPPGSGGAAAPIGVSHKHPPRRPARCPGGGSRGGRGPSLAWPGDLMGRWLRLGKGGREGGSWLRLAMGDLRGKGRGAELGGGSADCRDCRGRRLLLLLLLLLLFLGGGGGGSRGGWGGPRSAGGDVVGGPPAAPAEGA